MSDDSEDSGLDTISDQPSPRFNTSPEKLHESDDEFERRPNYRTLEVFGHIRQPLSLSQSVRETRRYGYLDLEHNKQTGKPPLSQSLVDDRPSGPYCKMKRWCSMDSGDSEVEANRKKLPLGGSIKRKLRRKSTKREKTDEGYGVDTEEYERIRARVLKEAAVVNAIEALQERWRMIMYMYHDCVDLNEGRKEREHKKLTVKRQLELIVIVSVFLAMCIPISVILVAMCR